MFPANIRKGARPPSGVRHRLQSKAAFALLFLLGPAIAPAAMPEKPQGYVSDFAGILDGAAKSRLNSLIALTEQKTSAEIAVVTVPSLEGWTVEDYAMLLFKKWGIGKKGKDNGVLVLVAPKERKVRIEVGYGLEPILPDGLTGQIIREAFVPAFKRGDFPSGIEDGVKRIATIISAGEPASKWKFRAHSNIKGPWLLTLFLSLFVGAGFFALGGSLGSKIGFFIIWGAGFGGIPLMMSYGFPLGFYERFVLHIFAIGMFIWGYLTGKRNPKAFRNTSGGINPGSGWVWGGGGGGFSGGGFSGGGGGGFGGGSSGGGGASGSW